MINGMKVALKCCDVCNGGRLLKDAVQDPTWGRRYERVLGALLCLCGAKLRAELEKQTHLVTLLGAVAERVRQAGGSTRQVSLCVCFCVNGHIIFGSNFVCGVSIFYV